MDGPPPNNPANMYTPKRPVPPPLQPTPLFLNYSPHHQYMGQPPPPPHGVPMPPYYPVSQPPPRPLPVKLIDAARQGYSQFQRDYGEQCQNQLQFHLLEPPSQECRFDFHPKTNLQFDVDDSVFIDPRPIQNFIEPGQREFKLFDDYNKAGADQIKTIYNVNTMDYCNGREICGKRLFPQSIERWPVDAIRSDLGELRRQALTIPGRLSQSAFINILDSGFEFDSTCFKENGTGKTPVGAFGLMSLARCLHGEGAEKNKLGYVTFVGMNLHKLFKDLDRVEPVCPHFAGPLSDRNHQLNFCTIEVRKGFREYDMGHDDNVNWIDGWHWKNQIRIKRRLVNSLQFDTLMFMFYTFHGDALQLLAAQQLYNMGWRFHKLFQVWITPAADSTPPIRWLPGVYTYFDYSKWDFMEVDLKHVNDGVLESRPMPYEEALWD